MSDRQIRSYHRAFLGELTLYRIGNLRPWRPIPARGIFWVAGLELLVFAATHVARLGIPVGSAGWMGAYLVVPLALAWLFTVAKIEGRRFHVAVRAWVRHALRGQSLVGGYRKLSFGPHRLLPSRIRVGRDR